MPGAAEAAPGAALGESAAAAVVARVFVPFAEFVVGVSVPFAAAPAASSQRPAVAAAVSDVLDPASAEVSGVPLSAGHRAFAVVVDISGPAFGSRCWEALDAHGAEYRSDGLDGQVSSLNTCRLY